MNRKAKTTATILIATITITGCSVYEGYKNLFTGWTESVGIACNRNYEERRPLYTSLSVYTDRLKRNPEDVQTYEDLQDTRAALRQLEREAAAIHRRCAPAIENRCCEDEDISPAAGQNL